MAGRDITITVGGKSTVQQEGVDPSLRALDKLSSGVSNIKSQLKGFATLWGFQRIAAGFARLFGDLDEIGDRLGGQLGQQAHSASESVGGLRDALRGITDEIAGRLSPHVTVLAKDLQELVKGTEARDGLGAWFETRANQASVLAEKIENLGIKTKGFGTLFNELLRQAIPQYNAIESTLGLGGTGEKGGAKVEAQKEEDAKRLKDAQLAEFNKQQEAIDKEERAWEEMERKRVEKEKKAADKKAADERKAIDKAEAEKKRKEDAQAKKLTERGKQKDQELERQAKSLKEANETPLEAYQRKLAGAQGLLQAGKITSDDYKKERLRLFKEMGSFGTQAPGLAATEAGALTRGRGVKVDPADQLVYMAKEAAKNDEEMKKVAERSAKALENLVALKGRGIF